ncbi:hypothetical protein NMY3_02187 [Candidatus Nitrosocosmicus oleophilus]|uniref:Uncharacterized protein n=1 Tax=Candidatus Nitrosocosmicus oleophilus TaxID=1353260 RepID=A0A654LZH3_9ARCH|nr:hypothetical protein [Candidatus Nitrosocosmicus oleophilus]ALI36387.1 hypothetical protein NMY3_02187 [Candidatus Nitrosocosmicus oleophilus]
MKWRVDKINRFLKDTYLKYYNTFSLNKNLLVSGIIGFLVSIVVAHISAEYSVDFVLNSALTVIAGYLTYKTVFAILFHIDNKQKYTRRLTGKLNFQKFKQILIKMLFASSVFDIVNNITRFILMIQLLKWEYTAVEATTISSIVASVLSYVIINIIMRYIHVFGSKKQ